MTRRMRAGGVSDRAFTHSGRNLGDEGTSVRARKKNPEIIFLLSVVVVRVLFFGFACAYMRVLARFVCQHSVMIMTQINVINLLAIVLNAVTCGPRGGGLSNF